MKSRTLTFVTAMIFFVALAIPRQLTAQHTHYTVTDLGTLGGTFGVAVGVNEAGWVNGQATLPGDTVVHAFFWGRGRMTDLGTLGGPNSAAFVPLNERGEISGVSDTSNPNPLGEGCFGSGFNTGLICRGFVWRKGVMTPLPTLGGYNSAATEINNRSQVAGIAENSTADPTCVAPQVLVDKPVIWENGVIHELPTPGGDLGGIALAINDYGQAVGHTGACGGFDQFDTRHAVLWQSGSVTDLGNLGGTTNNIAFHINNQGQVVGVSNLPGDTTAHAFLWQNGVMFDLGTLAGDVASGADSINSKGQVTGGSSDASGNGRAFLWQNGVMTDLNTLIPADSSLFLLEANSINSRGMIVGIAAQTTTGELHAFLATPSNGQAASESAAIPARGETNKGSKVTLPGNVRKMLQQRMAQRYHIHGLGASPRD